MNFAALNYSIHGLGRLNAVRPQVTSMRFGGLTIPPLQQPGPPQPTLEDRIVIVIHNNTIATAQEIADALFPEEASSTHLTEIQQALDKLNREKLVCVVGGSTQSRQYQLSPVLGIRRYQQLQELRQAA